jgi:ATP-dependent Clp endopeptidase proteolytic subunit ClpP
MSWIELVAQRHPPQPPAGMQPPENAKDWFRIENNADDVDATDIYVYDSIGGWFGMWAEDFIEQVNKVTTSKINLRLNSPGGSVFDGIAIANTIRSHPATVTVYVDSLAASIASVIAMAGDRLVMMPQSQIMVHNASGACYGDATEMTKMADLLDKQSLNIAQAYAQHTGGSLAAWQQYMDAETWFTAEEALAVGLADEVVPMRAKQTAPAAEPVPAEARMQRTWDLSMYRHAGREQAPAPQIPFANGGLGPMPGSVLTAQVLNNLTEAPSELVKLSADYEDEGFLNKLRSLIRDELAAAAPPFLPKKGEGDEEDEDGDEEEEAENATGEESQPDDSLAAAPPTEESPPTPVNEEPPEESPPDGTAPGPHDQADEQFLFAGLFHATSPRADDVFAQLKEGW